MTLEPFEQAVGAVSQLDGPRFGRRQREKAGQLAGVVPPATLFCSTIGSVNLIKGDDVAHVRLLQLSGAGSASHSGWSSAMGGSKFAASASENTGAPASRTEERRVGK